LQTSPSPDAAGDRHAACKQKNDRPPGTVRAGGVGTQSQGMYRAYVKRALMKTPPLEEYEIEGTLPGKTTRQKN